MSDTSNVIRLPRHWCGPDGVGQGGVTAGLLAADLLDGPVEVRLHAPAPLDTDMIVGSDNDGERTLVATDRPVATARRIPAVEGTPPPSVDLATARQASGALKTRNVFGHCLICGHRRDDSLRVWPGLLPDDRPGVAAAFEVPAQFRDDDTTLATPFVFGALDCTSGFAVLAATDHAAAITGTMQVQLHHPVPAQQPLVTIAQVAGRGGRSWQVDVALRSPAGALLAHARNIWVEVDPAVLGQFT